MTPGRSRKRKRKLGRIRAGFFNNNSSKYRTLLTSTVTAVLCMFALAATTYAWFHAKALTRSSSVTTGYMNVELMLSEDTIKEYIIRENWWKESHPEITNPSINDVTEADIEKYTGKTEPGKDLDKYVRQEWPQDEPYASPSETYYDITDKEMRVITLKDVEPGQVYPVSFYVANTGELAFTYSAGFKVTRSITGLERLDEEVADGKYGGKSESGEVDPEEVSSNREFKKRNRVLTRYQDRVESKDEEGKPVIKYIGGYLEDVLKVYIVPDDITEGQEREAVKDEENYVGTIAEITGTTGEDGEEVPPLLRRFTGYLLPENEVKITIEGKEYIRPEKVEILDNEGKLIETKENATELGRLRFLIVAPDDMTNLYQYAKLEISLGAYSTQVEYEKDGTNCMIYDNGAHEVPEELLTPESGDESENPLMSSPLLQGVLQNIEEENRRTQEDDSDGDVIIDDVTGSE